MISVIVPGVKMHVSFAKPYVKVRTSDGPSPKAGAPRHVRRAAFLGS